jgi:hypothetical protein
MDSSLRKHVLEAVIGGVVPSSLSTESVRKELITQATKDLRFVKDEVLKEVRSKDMKYVLSNLLGHDYKGNYSEGKLKLEALFEEAAETYQIGTSERLGPGASLAITSQDQQDPNLRAIEIIDVFNPNTSYESLVRRFSESGGLVEFYNGNKGRHVLALVRLYFSFR